MKLYQEQPCAECPWRLDVAPGQFEPDRFIRMAETAYDLAKIQFACHKSAERDIGCAGAVLRGSLHNLGARLSARAGRLKRHLISSTVPLHADYRSMAVANGVPPDHPALIPCRSNDD